MGCTQGGLKSPGILPHWVLASSPGKNVSPLLFFLLVPPVRVCMCESTDKHTKLLWCSIPGRELSGKNYSAHHLWAETSRRSRCAMAWQPACSPWIVRISSPSVSSPSPLKWHSHRGPLISALHIVNEKSLVGSWFSKSFEAAATVEILQEQTCQAGWWMT